MNSFQPKEGTAIVSSLVSGLFTSPKIRTTLGICFLMLLSIQSYGQDEDWTLLKEEAGIKVYFQIAQCESQGSDDPLELSDIEPKDDLMKLKLVNENSTAISVSFSIVTKIGDDSEFETKEISSGTTLIDSCDSGPKVVLTKESGDDYPISVDDFLTAFSITINQ